ncbi:ABC1 kinase family protein [Salisaeta longa]|uniref:ABC1 kinase family protein n=1 Tax=Salisaeta longa TaxID=503170 RepID=UPI0003B338B3|nr:AarF/UbiB family protein [Salisaeta longa]
MPDASSSSSRPTAAAHGASEETSAAALPSARGDGQAQPSPAEARQKQRSPLADFDPLAPYRGALRRFFTVYRHVVGLLMGGHLAYVRSLPDVQTRGLRSPGKRLLAVLLRPLVQRDLRTLPFPVQLRKRLEILGPTFTKLGQILAIREDLLPPVITKELERLMDHLPPIPFVQVQDILREELGGAVADHFQWVDEEPLGSASIAQAHRARTLSGDDVVVKVIKPGSRDVVTSDLKLLEFFGVFLQWIIPQYQPQQIIDEFSAYTLREVDYTFEADHAEVFAANFQEEPGIVFPSIYRHLSTENVLTMSFIDGLRPGAAAARQLSPEERARVIDLGATAIIRMLYQDGFFHADLHAGNLKIIPGDTPQDLKVGFIDLGMVGRFGPRVRQRMLYYFYALVRGDVENAARYLLEMARVGEGGDPQGFRRAVTDLVRHFSAGRGRAPSIAHMILESLSLGARYRVFFPVEMTLMVKALVTFEGVGRTLDPSLDVMEVSRAHVRSIFRERFDPRRLSRELISGMPEVLDLMVQLPELLSSGAHALEGRLSNRAPEGNPLADLRSGIIAGACIIAGVLAAVQGAAVWLWAGLLALGAGLALFGR